MDPSVVNDLWPCPVPVLTAFLATRIESRIGRRRREPASDGGEVAKFHAQEEAAEEVPPSAHLH